jgi:hypothetical protein
MPTYTIKPLATAIAINTGGRNGHPETTDHSVSVNLSADFQENDHRFCELGLLVNLVHFECSYLAKPPDMTLFAGE